MAKCKTCGAAVIFGRDDQGTKIILDNRNHPIYYESSPGVWMRHPHARVSHFVTCPQASQHSKKGKRGAVSG